MNKQIILFTPAEERIMKENSGMLSNINKRLPNHYPKEMSKAVELSNIEPKEDFDFARADGNCLCPVCNYPYKRHPNLLKYNWLTVNCSGEYLKL